MQLKPTILATVLALFTTTTAGYYNGVDVLFDIDTGNDTESTYQIGVVANFDYQNKTDVLDNEYLKTQLLRVRQVTVVGDASGGGYMGEKCDFFDGDKMLVGGVKDDRVYLNNQTKGFERITAVRCWGSN